MSLTNPFPFDRHCRFRAAHAAGENTDFPVTGEEWDVMHPLVRAVIGAITGDRIETTTKYDGGGRIVSVRTKRTERHHSARSIQSLLTSVRVLLQLELMLVDQRPHDGHPHDGNGRPVPGAQ